MQARLIIPLYLASHFLLVFGIFSTWRRAVVEEVENSSVTHHCGLDFNRCFTDLPFAGLIFQALRSALLCMPPSFSNLLRGEPLLKNRAWMFLSVSLSCHIVFGSSTGIGIHHTSLYGFLEYLILIVRVWH